jgi:hypothetical protein
VLGPESVSGVPRAPAIQLDTRPLWIETRVAQNLNLRDGQVVQAVAKAQDGAVRLWLKDFSFGVPNGWTFQDGDKPFLRVSLTSSGWGLLIQPFAKGETSRPALPLASQPATQLPATEVVSNVNARLSTLLLQPPGFSALLPWLQPGTLDALARSIGANDWLSRYKAASLVMAQLNPEALRRVIMAQARSAEHSLARKGMVEDEPKSLLRKLLAELAQEDGKALVDKVSQDLNRAVDELEASQLQTVQELAKGQLALHVVLPFVDADPVELFFHRPPRQNNDEAPPLSVDVHSRSRSLGEIWLNTTISSGRQVDLIMWALKEETVGLARVNASELQFELDAFDLKLQSFQIFHAPRPGQPEQWTPPSRGSVVDTQA